MPDIQFRKLASEDLPLLHQWFQVPHVKQWYARGETYSIQMIEEKYMPRIVDSQSIPNFIIYSDSRPIGYIQLYHLTHSFPEGVCQEHPLFQEYMPGELAGIDMFIADESCLGTGIASMALGEFIKQYVEGQFKAVVVDPGRSNTRAIRFYEKNGFQQYQDSDTEFLLYIKLL